MDQIIVRYGASTVERLSRAARFRGQSASDFLALAGQDAIHQALLEEAVARYRRNPEGVSLSELAAENDLAVEELMRAIAEQDRADVSAAGSSVADFVRERDRHDPERAEAVFLASCRTAAEALGDQCLLRRAEDVVAAQRDQRRGNAPSSQTEA